jgi:hypothetical protein
LAAAPAWAEDPTVHVQADVVLAEVGGNTLDPPSLKVMQDALGRKRRYGTLKRMSSERLELSSRVHTLKLPNGKDVAVSVEHIKDDVATLRVRVPPSDTTYKLGHSASLYVQAGGHQSGELWLVLAPAK